jgi:hypothetical protein
MRHRAPPSGISLTEEDSAVIKGMLARGDRQHDIAAWFGVNGGRIGEIVCGQKFRNVEAAPTQLLPPPGPYLSGRDAAVLMQAIAKARGALDAAESFIRVRPPV